MSKETFDINLRKLDMEELESRELLSVTLFNPGFDDFSSFEVASLLNDAAIPNPAIDLRSLNEIESERTFMRTMVRDDLALSAGTLDRETRDTSTIVVTTINDEYNIDNEDISLREAIEYYSRDVGGVSTITFAPELKGKTITLATGQITIDHSVNIIDSSKSITVDANEQSRIFYITASVTLEGLTLTKGRVNNQGGAILIDNGSLSIRRSSFIDNVSENSDGGAINSSGSNLVIENTW